MTTKKARVDNWGRRWDLPPQEVCPECGQPDSCGDCNHVALSPEEVEALGGRLRADELLDRQLAEQVLEWARSPVEHGGNPYLLEFVKTARRVVGDE